MKKEYISPEMTEFAFDTVGSMMVNITSDPSKAVDPTNSRAPGYDEDDDEEWEDEEDVVGGRRKVY